MSISTHCGQVYIRGSASQNLSTSCHPCLNKCSGWIPMWQKLQSSKQNHTLYILASIELFIIFFLNGWHNTMQTAICISFIWSVIVKMLANRWHMPYRVRSISPPICLFHTLLHEWSAGCVCCSCLLPVIRVYLYMAYWFGCRTYTTGCHYPIQYYIRLGYQHSLNQVRHIHKVFASD